jgi:glycine cleavage system H protein
MLIPKELRYTKEHEWVRIEGDLATFGISDYAQGRLGDVVFVELPEVGSEFKAGESFSVVESVKAASDIYAPAGCEVTGINDDLEEHPELVNQSPYERGWIVKVRLSDAAEIEKLMDAAQYEEFLKTEEDA